MQNLTNFDDFFSIYFQSFSIYNSIQWFTWYNVAHKTSLEWDVFQFWQLSEQWYFTTWYHYILHLISSWFHESDTGFLFFSHSFFGGKKNLYFSRNCVMNEKPCPQQAYFMYVIALGHLCSFYLPVYALAWLL